MAYESIDAVASVVSAVLMLVGVLYSSSLSRKSGKASAIWPLISLFFVFLLFYHVTEMVSLVDGFFLHGGAAPSGIHAAVEGYVGMPLGEFAEDFEHTAASLSAVVLLCVVLVIRRSVLVPI